jgi:hypothetical protein
VYGYYQVLRQTTTFGRGGNVEMSAEMLSGYVSQKLISSQEEGARPEVAVCNIYSTN